MRQLKPVEAALRTDKPVLEATVKIRTTDPDAFNSIMNFLAAAQYNAGVGHSATLCTYIDGDGAADVEIEGIPDANLKLGQDMASACGRYGGLYEIIGTKAAFCANVVNGHENHKSTLVYADGKRQFE